MGCAYPIKIKNIKYEPGAIQFWKREPYYFVPCGKCLGCQISKRTWLSTACEWEYNHYGIGSFTTLTYDQQSYLHLWNENKKQFMLSYKDFQDFMKRLRTNLYRKYGFRRDFKFLAVGEYGGKNGRCHFHVLYFGIDYKKDDMEIWKAWKWGIADNKPILNGGINYVLKYMDKAEMRKRNTLDFDFEKEERPFQYHSIGLGKGFIEEHLEDIKKNYGTYDRGDGKRHALPVYWLNKLCLKIPMDYTETKKEMIQQGYTNAKGKIKDIKYISKTEVLNWLMDKARQREQLMIRKSRDNGNAQYDFDDFLWKSIKIEMV